MGILLFPFSEKTLTGAYRDVTSADELVCCEPRGGGGTLMFSSNVDSGPASAVHQKKYQEYQASPKNI